MFETTISVIKQSAAQADRLAIFRHQARQEAEEKAERNKMSDAALAKLRAIREQGIVDAILNDRFSTALKSVIVTDENLHKLIQRCTSVGCTQIERRAQKLAWWIAAGYRLGEEIDTVTMIKFFSQLVDEEKGMTDTRFASLWNPAVAAKLKASRLNSGLSETPTISRACRSGKKCLRFEKRKPAPATGSGEYCSPSCGASARARAKRSLAWVQPTGLVN